MARAREQAAAIALKNGQVLIVGGKGTTPDTPGSAEIYNPGSPGFKFMADAAGDQALNSAEVYDPTANTFANTLNAMSSGRFFGATAVLPDGRVLVAGGTDQSFTSTKTTDIYDPATDSFTPGASMKQVRAAFGMVSLANGDVLVAGGIDFDPNATTPTPALTSTEMYNPTQSTWTTEGDLPTGSLELAMVTLPSGEVLEAGGTPDTTGATTQAAVFDPAFAPSAPTGATATAGDGRALVSWTAASPNGAPVTGYTVTASTGQTVHLTGTTTSTTVTDLTNGIPVTFTVTATNSVGTSTTSAPSAAVTPTTPPTTTPTTQVVTPPAGSRPAPDTAAKLTLSRFASRMTLKQFLKGLRFTVTPSKAVALQVTLAGTVNRAVISRFNLALASKRFGLSRAKRSVKLVPSRRLVGHPRTTKVQLTIVAIDAAGTRSTVTRTLTIKG